jgi:hypothetical protein
LLDDRTHETHDAIFAIPFVHAIGIVQHNKAAAAQLLVRSIDDLSGESDGEGGQASWRRNFGVGDFWAQGQRTQTGKSALEVCGSIHGQGHWVSVRVTGVTGVKTRRNGSTVLRVEGQTHGVNAVAQVGGCPIALAGEHVPQVATTGSASDLDTSHAMTDVLDLYDGVAGER